MKKFWILLLISTIFINCKAQSQNKKKNELSNSLMVGEYIITSNGVYPDSVLTKIEQTNLKKRLPEYLDLTKIPDSLELIADKNLTGDFNGDNLKDFASIVKNKKDQKIGVIIIHNSNIQENFVFGAGNKIDDLTDLNWIEIFKTLPKGETVSPTLIDKKTGDIIGQDESQNFELIGNGIYMSVGESHGGGILFWNREEYKWYHIE